MTKIKVEPLKIHYSIQLCAVCDENNPIYYCVNDKQVFCDNCWVSFHEGRDSQNNQYNQSNDLRVNAHFLRNHERVEIDYMPKDFGTCLNHDGRKNEYYNNVTSQAYCSMCVVEGVQKLDSGSAKTNQSALVAIEKAYSNAYDDAQKDDI